MELMVLGGGIAGISCAYHAGKAGVRHAVLEEKERPGGLLDNFRVEGFRFDQAIHLSFTNDSYVRSLFDPTPYRAHYPDVWCFESPHWLKHPVQNNLFPLPVEERVRLVKGFFSRPEQAPENYREWLVHQYGEEIASRYPVSYTRKYWGVEPERLGLDWIGSRLRRACADEILRGSMTSETGNGYYAPEMRYPKEGGYRAFIEPMLADLKVSCGKKVVRVDLKARRVFCADGSHYDFGVLVNTLPLPLFVQLLADAPEAVREAAATLWATRVDLLSVGIAKPDAIPHLWFYLYDQGLLPARAYSVGHKSPDNVPAGCSALQFEVYSSRHRPLTLTAEELKAHAVECLQRLGIAAPSEILFVDHRTLPYGNVVFDLGMEKRRGTVRDYLEGEGVILAGRFGEWEYFWSDQALLSGKRAAERSVARLSGGADE